MRQLGEFQITDNKKLVLAIGEYRGDERIDLRQHVKVKAKKSEDKWIATRKGVNFNSEWLDGFVEMVGKLRDE